MWRNPGEEFQAGCTEATVKHRGGNIKVWDCFSYSGADELVFINELRSLQRHFGCKPAEVCKDTPQTLTI